MKNRILTVKDLNVTFNTYVGKVHAVRGVSFHVDEEEILAIVGESGCGKTVTAQSIMRLNPSPPCEYTKGSIQLGRHDIFSQTEKQMNTIRGNLVSMIFQDPITSLNPTTTIGRQIAEPLMLHQNMTRKQAMQQALEMLKVVQIPDAERRINQHPFEFSGGMRQRAMIAMALACNPRLLIADEPTTALDVTIQAQIIDLLKNLKDEVKTAIILITHNLGLVASLADRVVVMYAGEMVESGDVHTIFRNPKHPYTIGLQSSIPRVDQDRNDPLRAIDGTPPDLFNPCSGCSFCARCKHAMRICKEQQPPLYDLGNGHASACWLLHPQAPVVDGFERERG